MKKSYKFQLFRNKKKTRKLSNELWQFHLIYNHCLALTKRHYKLFGKNPTKFALQKHLKRLMERGLHPQWKELGFSQGIQQVTERIHLSYAAFFEWAKSRKGERKSPLKFKPFRKYKSFTLKQAGWTLDQQGGRVRIGSTWYRYNKSRSIQCTPKTLTIKRDRVGDWFIVISCELEKDYIPKKLAAMTGKSAGFDFGLKCFLKSSDNDDHTSNQYLKTHLKQLKRCNRNLSRKT